MTIYKNKWCKIICIDTYYYIQYKDGYKAAYFLTIRDAYKYIGIKY